MNRVQRIDRRSHNIQKRHAIRAIVPPPRLLPVISIRRCEGCVCDSRAAQIECLMERSRNGDA
jgi:hypothetical protein